MQGAGVVDVRRARDRLAQRLPGPLHDLAALAMNYRWSWTGGAALFEAVDPHRWEMSGGNPVRLLLEASDDALATAAADARLVERAAEARADLEAHVAEASSEPPVAFLCAEFAVHASLPIYSGGLGVLAGDMLKESSDRNVPLFGVGLLYRQGYFRQRLDRTGWQVEWWSDVEPERLPMALVTGADGAALRVEVPMHDRTVVAQVWRVDVGRVALYLLDTERPENGRIDRWITSRLYIADRSLRLAQYELLGRGAVAALEALGLEPATLHLNEGHAAFAPLELARRLAASGLPAADALAEARRRTVFTTHTPVAAGNETIDPVTAAELLGGLARDVGVPVERLLDLGRVQPGNRAEPVGLTQLGIRMSRSTNAVSRRHGLVARAMWHELFGRPPAAGVPIDAVTNGVHLPTWMAGPMAELLDRHLPEGWRDHAADPATWEAVAAIPDAAIWETRSGLRAGLVRFVRDRSVHDRLARGEGAGYVEAAAHSFRDDVLTLGFARRLATYKRLHLLAADPVRAQRLLGGDRPVQIVLAGKAHPQDDAGKEVLRRLFGLRGGDASALPARVVFLEDYDMSVAAHLVAGCDVWVNLPRFPLEACGTSGMKAAMNGALHLSIRDGWWEEAWEGGHGWGFGGEAEGDEEAVDALDARTLMQLLETEVVPDFYERDANGIPAAWVRRVRACLTMLVPRFCAGRMVDEYRTRIWPAPDPVAAG